MTSYTVHVLLQEGSKQLLLVNDGTRYTLAVYDEHTGQTLMRMTTITIDMLKQAVELLA